MEDMEHGHRRTWSMGKVQFILCKVDFHISHPISIQFTCENF